MYGQETRSRRSLDDLAQEVETEFSAPTAKKPRRSLDELADAAPKQPSTPAVKPMSDYPTAADWVAESFPEPQPLYQRPTPSSGKATPGVFARNTRIAKDERARERKALDFGKPSAPKSSASPSRTELTGAFDFRRPTVGDEIVNRAQVASGVTAPPPTEGQIGRSVFNRVRPQRGRLEREADAMAASEFRRSTEPEWVEPEPVTPEERRVKVEQFLAGLAAEKAAQEAEAKRLVDAEAARAPKDAFSRVGGRFARGVVSGTVTQPLKMLALDQPQIVREGTERRAQAVEDAAAEYFPLDRRAPGMLNVFKPEFYSAENLGKVATENVPEVVGQMVPQILLARGAGGLARIAAPEVAAATAIPRTTVGGVLPEAVASRLPSRVAGAGLTGEITGAELASRIAVGAQGAGAQAVQAYEAARAAGKTHEEALFAAAIEAPIGFSEMLGSPASVGATRARTLIRQEAKQEGFQEGFQQGASGLSGKYVAGYDPNKPISDIVGETIGGAGLGAAVGGLIAAPGAMKQAGERQYVRRSIDQRSATNRAAIAPEPPAEAEIAPVVPVMPPTAPPASSPASPAPPQPSPGSVAATVPSPLFPDAQQHQAPQQDISALDPQQRTAALLDRLRQQQEGRKAASLEQQLNTEFAEAGGMVDAAAQGWDADRATAEQLATTGAARLKSALQNLQKSEGYATELGAVASGTGQPGPYIAAAQALQTKLEQAQGLFTLDAEREREQQRQQAEAEKVQKEAEREAEKLQKKADKEARKQAIFTAREEQKRQRQTAIEEQRAAIQQKRDDAVAKRLQTAETAKEARRVQLEQQRAQARDEKAKKQAEGELQRIALHDAALQAADGAGQRHQEYLNQGMVAEAINELIVQQNQLRDAVKYLPRTPESQNTKADLNRYQGQIGNRIGDLRAQMRGKSVPVTQAVPPLFRPEAVANPDGGAPELPSFYEPGATLFAGPLADAQPDEAAPLLTAIRRLGGIQDDGQFSGELRQFGSRESSTTGIVNNRTGLKPDRMREALVEDGLLPEGATIDDLFQAMKQADMAVRSPRQQETIDEFYERWVEEETEGQRDGESLVEAQQSVDEEIPEGVDPEEWAAYQRTLARSNEQNPRPYNERTRPAEPGSGGVSLSGFSVMLSRHGEKIDRLREMNLNSPEAQAIIAEIRADNERMGIEHNRGHLIPHVDALIAQIQSEQFAVLKEEDRQEEFANLAERESRVRDKIEQQAALSSPTEEERVEAQVYALDEFLDSIKTDPELTALFDAAILGDKESLFRFAEVADVNYGLDEDTIHGLITSRRQAKNQPASRATDAASQSGSTRSDTAENQERWVPPDAAEPTAAQLSLLRSRPNNVPDADYDQYLEELETLYRLAEEGRVSVDPRSIYNTEDGREKNGNPAPILVRARAERHSRREANRLPSKAAVRFVDEYGDSTVSDLVKLAKPSRPGKLPRINEILTVTRVVLEKRPTGVSPRWMARLEQLHERALLAQQQYETAQQQEVDSPAEPRTITHPNPAIDGKEVIRETDDGRVIVANPENKTGVSVVKDRTETAAEKFEPESAIRDPQSERGRLAYAVADYLGAGGKFANIVEARKFISQHSAWAGGQVSPGTSEAKQVDEAIEAGAVIAARRIVAEGRSPLETYRALLKLQDRLPTLSARTSTSVMQQAYSSPLPLAYVASQLAGINWDTTVYEPSVGHSALLITAKPENIVANELNEERAAAVRDIIPGAEVTENDAAEWAPKQKVDRVIANPPFGPVKNDSGQSRRFEISGKYSTTEIDHAIAFEALKAMKDDGRAVLIVGGLKFEEEGARSNAYNTGAKRNFYFTLYNQYNVTDHFTVSGDLYAKQGAGWPVDVIVIDGKGESKRALPAVAVPRIIQSWSELEEKLNAPNRSQNTESRTSDDVRLGERGLPGGERDSGASQRADNQFDLPGVPDRPNHGNDRAGSSAGMDAPVADRPTGSRRTSGSASEFARSGRSAEQPDLQQSEPARPAERPGRVSGPADAQQGQPARETTGTGNQPGTVAERTDAGTGRTSDVGDIFDEWIAEQAQPPVKEPPRQTKRDHSPRTAKESTKSAAKETAKGLDDIAKGFAELFNDPNRLGSGPVFDEKTYAKAKPYFEAAVEHFKNATTDVRDVVRRLLTELKNTYNFAVETIQQMKPYVVRFVEEFQSRPVSQASQADTESSDTHRAYKPTSRQYSVGTLVPVNMADAVENSLRRLKDEAGDLDDYIADRLGYKADDLGKYFSGEQVDALALAIRNIENGGAFILGDQTGIGKGRVVAGVIRYAIKNRITPIFVTEKPTLYGDMIRDLADIGSAEVKPLITNSGESVPLDDDALAWYGEAEKASLDGRPAPPKRGRFLQTKAGEVHNAMLKRFAESGNLDGHQALFTTYNQMQTVQGKMSARHDLMRRFANGGIVIFDESHNAGGAAKPETDQKGEVKFDRAQFARQLARDAKGILYSSATFAKRPEVMDLYFRTELGSAVGDLAELSEITTKGGVPMQQVIASMLAESGQYIRRERSFKGVEYAPTPVKVDRRTAENVSRAMREVAAFDMVKQEAVKTLGERVKADAKRITGDGTVGQAGVSSVNFTSLMHNLIDQSLLALKVDQAAEMAIQALERGEKPVVTVANTMGSFIQRFAEENELQSGAPINLSFNDLLARYLERSREVIVGKPYGEKFRHYLSDEELGEAGVRAYEQARKFLVSINLDIPISPIDWLHQKLRAAGYRTGEITGRGHIVNYTADGPVYATRPASETSTAAKKRTIAAFNDGTMDVIILNQSGSTGISLHASEKFKDQRRRHMIIAQAEKNIDTHMQMLGRVHRTGQVIPPRYTQMVADIPAELRPAAVLGKKMASLNANTTASRSSAVTSKDTPDFLNKYGDDVAASAMEADPDLHRLLGRPLKESERSQGLEREDAMRKVTGRIPLLPIGQQEKVYELLIEEYADTLQQAEAMGENGLEAKTLDLQAETTKTQTLVPGSGKSLFEQAAQLERVKANRQGKPFKSSEVIEKLQSSLGEQNSDLQKLQKTGREKINQTRDSLDAEVADYKNRVDEQHGDTKRGTIEQLAADKWLNRWNQITGTVYFGATVQIAGGYGIVLNVERKGNRANPVALSGWRATIAMADARRQLTVPFSKIDLGSDSQEGNNRVTVMSGLGAIVYDSAKEDFVSVPILEAFDKGLSSTKENRYVVTGNLIAGFSAQPNGQIVNFTDSEGRVRQGILMPVKFDPAEVAGKQKQKLKTADAVMAVLKEGKRGEVTDRTGDLAIRTGVTGGFVFSVPSAKGRGGKYYLNKPLLQVAETEFAKRGGLMELQVRESIARRMIESLLKGDGLPGPVALQAKAGDENASGAVGAVKEFLKNEGGSASLGLGIPQIVGKVFNNAPPKTTPLRSIVTEHKPLIVDPIEIQNRAISEILDAAGRGVAGTLPGARALHWAKKLKIKPAADKLANRQAKFIQDVIEKTNEIIASADAMQSVGRGSLAYHKARQEFYSHRRQLHAMLQKTGDYSGPVEYLAKYAKASLLTAPHILTNNVLDHLASFPFHEAQKLMGFLLPVRALERWGVDVERTHVDFRDLVPAMAREFKAIVNGTKDAGPDFVHMLRYGTTDLLLDEEIARQQIEQGEEKALTGGADKYEFGKRAKGVPGLDHVITAIGRSHGAVDVAGRRWAFATAITSQADAIAKRIGKENGFTNEEVSALREDLAAEPSPQMIVLAMDEANRFVLDYPTFLFKLIQASRKIGEKEHPLANKAYNNALDFIVKFQKIPLAAQAQSLWHYSPLGLGGQIAHVRRAAKAKAAGKPVSKQESAEIVERLQQGALGTLVWAGAGLLGSLGYLQFTGGDDRERVRNAEQALGYGYDPELKVGDTAVTMNRFGTFGRAGSVAARLAKAAEERKDAKTGEMETENTRIKRVSKAFMKGVVLDNPVGRGVGEWFDSSQGDPMENFARGQIRSLQPGFLREIAKVRDGKKRIPDQVDFASKVEGDLKAGNPWLRESLQPRLDALGREMEEDNPFLPFRRVKADPQLDEMIRLGTGPSKPRRERGESSEEYNRRVVEQGSQTTETMRRIADDPRQAGRSDEAKARIYSAELMKRSAKLSDVSVETEREIESLRADAYEALRKLPAYQQMKDSDREKVRGGIDAQLNKFRARAASARSREKVARMPEFDPLVLARTAVVNAGQK